MAKKSVAQPELGDFLKQQRVDAKVERAVKAIRKAHADGCKFLVTSGKERIRRKGAKIPEVAAKRGIRRDAVERARQFAQIFKLPVINQLCSECRDHNFPLGVSLIYRVLPLGDAEKCMEVLRRAMRKGWTQRRLVAEIHKRPGAKSHTGRPRAMPKSPTEACRQIVIRVAPVMRWLEDVKTSLGGKLDEDQLGKISKAVIALEALVEAAS